jgi:hypothetical protein
MQLGPTTPFLIIIQDYMNNNITINWDNVIETLSQPGIEISTDPTKWNLDNLEYKDIYDRWQAANFNVSAIKWTNYYPGRHFDDLIIKKMSHYLNVNVHRAWISRIDPGFFAPWHWDVDDKEYEYLKKGTVIRYSIFIGGPAHGHIFIIGEDYYFNQPQGTVVKWRNYKEWHSGINAGMSPKYMLHILAY